MHHLLERQLNELGLDGTRAPEGAAWHALLERVQSTYSSAEHARTQLERSIATSSQEMLELAQELRLSPNAEPVGDKQKQLHATRAVLDATLDALADGVLVVAHETRAVSLFNRRFVEMWGIPADALASRDDKRLLSCVVSLLSDPDEFFSRIGYLYEHPTEVSQEQVRLVDGRIFDRHSAPVLALTGEVLGRVWFFHDATQRVREEEELRAARATAEQAARELWSEMDLARKIQTVLLPTAPELAGYDVAAVMAPASSVGGDYYDIFDTDGGRWVLIGDVSGHGVPAGLVMMMARTAIRVAAFTLGRTGTLAPSTLVATVNQLLRESIRKMGDDYMTLTALRVDGGTIQHAGLHLDMLVHRATSGQIETIESYGVWLGIVDDIASLLEDRTFRLEPGDTLLLFTDGVTESRRNGELLGNAGLAHLLSEAVRDCRSCEEVVAHVMKELETRQTEDDVTLMALRRLPGATAGR